MLTEEEKARIRAEEAFRMEVRRELTGTAPVPTAEFAGQTLRQRLWAMLNSAVGMWFLTTVAAGAITTAYQWGDASLKRQSEIRLATGRIGTELNNRIDAIEERLESASTDADVVAALGQLDAGTIRIFDDLKERNVVSLLIEIGANAKGAYKADVQAAIQAARQLERLRRVLQGKEAASSQMLMPEIRAQIKRAVDELRLACMR